MIRIFLFLSCGLALSSCASVRKISHDLKPAPVRASRSVIERGWVYSEKEETALNMESGAQPINFGSPILYDEKIIYTSDRFGVTAVHRDSGKLLWKHRTNASISSAPVISQQKLFVGDDHGIFRALSPESGREFWSTNLGHSIMGSPTIVNDRIIVSTIDEAIHALDHTTGKEMWVYRRPVTTTVSIKGGGNSSFIQGKIWVGFSDGTLVALEPNDGSVSFEKQFRDNLKFTDIDAKPIAWKDGILVNSYDGKLRHLRKDGTILWEFNAGGAKAPLISPIDHDVLYLPSSDGTVYALNNNKDIWRFSLNQGVPTALAFFANKSKPVLIVATSDKRIYALNALTGREIGRNSLGQGSGTFATVAADEDRASFYVVSQWSRLYQFKINYR
jgi:outer membrane protein assembly factor BamB